MVNITATILTSMATTITTSSHSHITTTIFLPTTFITTFITTLTTVFPTSTEVGVPFTATFTTSIPTTSIEVINVDVNPVGPLVGIYFLPALMLVPFLYLSFRAHYDQTDVYRFYWHYFWFSISVFTLGFIATVLSWTIPHENYVVHEIWGVHFNIGCDIVTVLGAFAALLCSLKVDLCGRGDDQHLFFLSLLIFLCASMGLFSSVCSLSDIKNTTVAKAGGWFIGGIMWVVGVFLFGISEWIFLHSVN
jgi:hypothetical protein